MYLTNFYKKCLLKLKYNAKSVCVFHLFLIDIPSILILSVKNTGWGGGRRGGRGWGVAYRTKSVNREKGYLSTVVYSVLTLT